MKTKPHTIRFEESEYDFICKRENLKTAQSILDFLMSEYMKIYKVEKPSIFISATKESYNGKNVDTYSMDESAQFEQPKSEIHKSEEKDFFYFKDKILKTTSREEIEKVVREVDEVVLTFIEKRDLKLLAKTHSINFYTD